MPDQVGHDLVSLPARPVISYLLSAVATSTAQATVQPTIGLLPIPSFFLRTEHLSVNDNGYKILQEAAWSIVQLKCSR